MWQRSIPKDVKLVHPSLCSSCNPGTETRELEPEGHGLRCSTCGAPYIFKMPEPPEEPKADG